MGGLGGRGEGRRRGGGRSDDTDQGTRNLRQFSAGGGLYRTS